MSATMVAAVPTCPTHGKAMRLGPKGPWFCPTSMGTDAAGNKLWCQEKSPRTGPPAYAPAAAAPVHDSTPLSDSRTALAVAAMDFASRIYEGSGPVGDEAGIDLAKRAFAAFVSAS